MAVFIGIFLALIVINVALLLFSTSQRTWVRRRQMPKSPAISKTKIYSQG